MVTKLATPEHQVRSNFIVRALMMKNETYQELLSRLREVEAELTRRAIREMGLSTQNLKPMRWISLLDQTSFVPGKIGSPSLSGAPQMDHFHKKIELSLRSPFCSTQDYKKS